MQLGTILMIVTSLWFIAVIASSAYFKRLENKFWFWFVVGAAMFFYMFFARQIQFVIPGFNDSWENSPTGVSLRHSRLLLLDICPFFSIFGGLALMSIKDKKLVRAAAPIATFGGLITLYGELFRLANQYNTDAATAWKWIFLGDGNDQIYFMLHVMTTSVGLMLICWTTNWSWKDLGHQWMFVSSYSVYVLVCINLDLKILGNSTGLLPTDWAPGGEYQSVAKILGFKGDRYWDVVPVGITLSMVAINLLWGIRYGLQQIYRNKIQPRMKNENKNKINFKDWYKQIKYSVLTIRSGKQKSVD
ncbi:DUF5378 family protein [Mycoplasma sp. E35C]|uniref:DUF5378 family protein n=1 Tax=Mycoplasma sp. E35C TaxID=2801918 RepID=UPI001CA38E33|nr:DUF5378 family protein [Mycoplasma sp. E35C]QZX49185.1 DUF5378 family protein [Mycoplasma sp. E35C]